MIYRSGNSIPDYEETLEDRICLANIHAAKRTCERLHRLKRTNHSRRRKKERIISRRKNRRG